MALINCENCGKEISDKAKVCPQCGNTICLEVVEKTICEECQAEIPSGSDVCTNCGCPVPMKDIDVDEVPQKVEIASVNLPKMKKTSKKLIIIAVIALVAVLCAGILIKKNHDKKVKAEYSAALEEITYTMLTGAADAEEAANLIKSVWYNTIYEKSDITTDRYTKTDGGKGSFYSDFNTALMVLFLDEDFISLTSDIETNQETVSNMMKELKNPPKDYEDAYEALKEYYDAYLTLTNIAVDPSGSLQTYSESFSEADAAVLNCYNTMELYIGE